MYTGMVIGTVVATQKWRTMEGKKLLLVQPYDENRKPRGKPIVAVDALGTSGRDEFVYIVTKKEAAFPFKDLLIPVDQAVVGYIDEYEYYKEHDDPKKIRVQKGA